MALHWKEMLPIDRYLVASNGLLHDYDRKILTLLYQPLIGPLSYSLYMTLWAQVEENRLWSDSNSHHSLMGFMGLKLNEIYDARLKLEGIGLLKTYVKQEEDNRTFIYELLPPLTPDQFFLDGMLNVYLYRKIGKNQYAKLKNFFSDTLLHSLEGYAEVTRNFQDVYDSAIPSALHQQANEMETDFFEQGNLGFISRNESNGVFVDPSTFDFDLLLAGLSESLVPKKAITPKVREAISKLSYLYGIDAIQMKNLIIDAMDVAEEVINIEDLRKAARDWYQIENHDGLPLLVDKIQPPVHQSELQAPKTKEEKLIHYLDTTSPRQLLMDTSGGAEASKADLQIIEDVMFKQNLMPGVVNVLIQYVLLKTDMKLTKGYVDKIASHWARKKVKTVSEAMELAKNEHRQYLEWANNKKSPKQAGKKQPTRVEAIPKWFDEKEGEQKSASKTDTSNDYEGKKRELEERLKKYKK
ncbi:replication initiation and membrane attachment family protein [Bacillus dakarensis]|uniref:replication initiation and membrane attachment family protein n=1 Tax=Robertmurraya dakarensis TaxID=1926278 RepID=UPI0009816C4B|nr:replication initiation and membrane attachment family protein [Bacillus dakarensis]